MTGGVPDNAMPRPGEGPCELIHAVADQAVMTRLKSSAPLFPVSKT